MYKSDTQEYYRVVTCNICCVVLWWKCKYSYTYDAWGNLTSVKNANGAEITSQNHIAFLNPIRYRGQRFSKIVLRDIL